MQIEDSVESHSPVSPTLPSSVDALMGNKSMDNIQKYQTLLQDVTKRYQPKIALKNLATDKGKKTPNPEK